ncbi:hypothetical protein ABD76_25435 [Paenibacillus dendritiformis]|nr:hypothetical protein [Paenibacillus dendritiformis]
MYDPKWFYLFRAKQTGEIKEYRLNSKDIFGLERSDGEWFDWLRGEFVKLEEMKRENDVFLKNRDGGDSHA